MLMYAVWWLVIVDINNRCLIADSSSMCSELFFHFQRKKIYTHFAPIRYVSAREKSHTQKLNGPNHRQMNELFNHRDDVFDVFLYFINSLWICCCCVPTK